MFQCQRCRAIVGDSEALITISEALQLVVLKSAHFNNIQREGDIHTSKAGDDVGSTFYRFSCKLCSSVLGKYYLTTSRDLDPFRESFSFEIDKITSYQLGTSLPDEVNSPVLEIASADVAAVMSNEELTLQISKVRCFNLISALIFAVFRN